ncbi:MAG: hypothetical protein AB7U73_16450 [Pirellulales bacterium]
MKRLFALFAVLFFLFSGAVYFLDEVLGTRATGPTTTVRPLWFASGRARAAESYEDSATGPDLGTVDEPYFETAAGLELDPAAEPAGDAAAQCSPWSKEPGADDAEIGSPGRQFEDGAATATDLSEDAPRAPTSDARFGARLPRGSSLTSPATTRRRVAAQAELFGGSPDDTETACGEGECSELDAYPHAPEVIHPPFELGLDGSGPLSGPECDAGCDGELTTAPSDEPGRPARQPRHTDMGQRLTARTQAVRAATGAANRTVAASEQHIGRPAPSSSTSSGEAVVLQWVTPDEVSVGQPAPCRLIVHNTAAAAVDSVEVHADLPEHLRIERSSLEAADDQGRVVWALGQLAPGQTKAIDLDVTATDEGDFNPVASVTFSRSCATHIQALRPELKLAIEGPAQVLAGQPANYALVVSNVGTGRASAVQVGAHFDGALSSTAGQQKSYSIGSLAAGESRRIVVMAVASDIGTCRVLARTIGQGELHDQAELEVAVVSPRVEVGVAGPRLRFVDHDADYTLRVHNPGRAAASNVQVVVQLPEGMRFAEADGGATCDLQRGQVTWFVGHMEPDQACQFNLRLTAVAVGDQRIGVETSLESGHGQLAEFVTRVEGIADVAIEVVDSQDPVELGGETTYEVRVTNRGSQTAHQVQIAARLSAGCEALDTDGPTAGKIDRAQVVFEPISTLEAGGVETYHVRVGCGQVGQFGFRAFVRCQEQPRPAVQEEPTRVYEE